MVVGSLTDDESTPVLEVFTDAGVDGVGTKFGGRKETTLDDVVTAEVCLVDVAMGAGIDVE